MLHLLEYLVLGFCNNVSDSSFALEMLSSKCPNMKVVKLGEFQRICLAIGSRLDGIGLFHRLQSLFVSCCGDLKDMGLVKVGRGCSWEMIDINVASCVNLDATTTLRAFEPIQHKIETLHLDYIWKESDNLGHSFLNFDLNDSDELNDSELMECFWVQINVFG
ncbi:hypothetical protein KIW84_030651 [Lathyrus oleraceus]|uniref:Uncharacterized protein n=1 Tax=Pisum sativum TaxID=3888 RepID=A0A9D5AU90_PEA|nr:hypothetical protein KIW84_030651 [Pisum sativum]